nr:MAG: biotin/lipoyl-binding protein [Leptolyngbya sp. IPPAS B-1204]
MSLQSLPKRSWIVGLSIAATVLTGGLSLITFSQFSARTPTESVPAAPSPRKVGALGRLEPEAKVIELSAPIALDGDRVAQLLVNEGDQVTAGQVIAILDSRDRLADALRQAEQQVAVAQARLAQVQAGAKTGEIQAQQATIGRLQAELTGTQATQTAEIARWQAEVRTAQAEFDRFRQLFEQGAIAASDLDSKRLALETAQAQLNQAQAEQTRTRESLQAEIRQAQATLDQIAEVRPVDVQAAQTEVKEAIAAAARAKTDLEQAYIRAPIDAQILKIQARAGEKIGDAGIVELAQTNQMVAVAEVYQSDIGKVEIGQPAVVTGSSFAGELRGTVSQIGLQVSRQNVFSNEPGENLDRRVVEVKIRLNPTDSQKVAGLTNLQVHTEILVGQPEIDQPEPIPSPKADAALQLQVAQSHSACSTLKITNARFKLNRIC